MSPVGRSDAPTSFAIDWLLRSDEPAIRWLTSRDLLAEERLDDRAAVLDGPLVSGLLTGQQEDGGFGGHPYRKWTGAHWRLISLVELGLPAGESRALRALETVLGWLTGPGHRGAVKVVAGRARRCASQEGNALAVASCLGMAHDPRVKLLASSLLEWQWPDGGWNCDARPAARNSSVNETLAPAWGLWEYALASLHKDAREGAQQAAESLLERRIFRSRRTGQVMHPAVIKLHWPPYWHYDVLRALVVLERMGLVRDGRASDALDLLEGLRLPDGRWEPGASWWSPPGSSRSPEVVDWGRSGPNEMITLHALTAMRAAGRL